MSNLFNFLFIILIHIAINNAGTCPKYPLIRDFDFKKYLGLWYQQDKKQAGWEAPGRCWKSLYLKDPRNGQFKMRMMFENTITKKEEKYDSQLTLQGPRRPSVIKYSIPLTFWETEFQVLATDYDSFSVEYKCHPNGFLEKQESVFLLTRLKNPSPIVLQRAYAIMHRYGIDIRKLERVDQTCGGIQFDATPGLQEYPDYEYYDSPKQELPENRRHQIENDGRYDYYVAIEEAPSSQKPTIRKRPTIKKRHFASRQHRIPNVPRIQFGHRLTSQAKKYFAKVRANSPIN